MTSKVTYTELMLSDEICKQLLEASKRSELIGIRPHQRGIGKTTGLIKVARQLDAYVLVGTKYMARYLTEASGYDKIVGGLDIVDIDKGTKVVLDQGARMDMIRDMSLEVLTGFYTI